MPTTSSTSGRAAFGFGLATTTTSGQTLDVWYPHPRLGEPRSFNE